METQKGIAVVEDWDLFVTRQDTSAVIVLLQSRLPGANADDPSFEILALFSNRGLRVDDVLSRFSMSMFS